MAGNYNKFRDSFYDMDRGIKIIDIPAIVATILDCPLPFVNLGVIHPVFVPSDNTVEVHRMFLLNLMQMQEYVREYCDVTNLPWCQAELHDFHRALNKFSKFQANRAPDIDVIEHLDIM